MHLGKFKKGKEIFFGVLGTKNTIINIMSGEEINFDDEVKILPPFTPTKIILVGLNYKDHAKELNFDIPDEPVIFLKPPSTIIGHNDNIIYPSMSKRVDYEAELAFIIKKECYKISEKDAYKYILGYTCLNDVTARDLQKKDGQWTRAKSFNTFAPVGPYVYIPDENENFDPHNLKIVSRLNGNIKQSSNTSNLIFSIPYLLSFISHIMKLESGDIISTGTPAGIGPMNVDDTIEIEIEKIGILKNKIIAEQ